MANKVKVMWGIPRGSTERYEEVLLLSDASNPAHVEKVKALATKDGFHSFRIATIDLDQPPDFTKGIK